MESLKRLQSLALLGDAQACEELKRAYERAADLEGWRAFLRDLDTEGIIGRRLRVRILASLYQEPFDWVKFCELVEQESGEGRISLVAWLQPLVLKTDDTLRLALKRWTERFVSGEDVPELGLCTGLFPFNVNWLQYIHSPQLKTLTRLRCPSLKISVTELQPLMDAQHLTSLRDLNLSNNPLGVEGVAALIRTPHLNQLTHLDLSECDVGVDGANMIASASCWDHLTHLYLSNNKFGDAGCRAILLSKHFPSLSWLDLSYNGSTESIVSVLEQATHLRLVGLNMSMGQNYEQVRSFPHMSTLRHLYG